MVARSSAASGLTGRPGRRWDGETGSRPEAGTGDSARGPARGPPDLGGAGPRPLMGRRWTGSEGRSRGRLEPVLVDGGWAARPRDHDEGRVQLAGAGPETPVGGGS